MGDPFNQAKAIFLAAIEEHTPEQWPAFLEQACGGDVRLRSEVEKFLRARSAMGSFHEAPRPALLATVDEPSLNERPGTVIGPYKLLEQIGEGGFGVVFMAEQQQPIRRKVALKVLKPGMDTRQVVARFEAERQALALMDHPNIAHVLEGGETASGRPYFVMELVRGIPITDFCDQNRLFIRERLELFVDVCQAVQHAHQKGIIHRDIKPSNVLVTLYDGKPLVKVIDFGIAKATGQQLTDKTLFTHFAQMMGTPLYMSPEQAGMSGQDVDTRSDIYSLGVLLYELLTGTTPFDRERLREADYDEIRRIIREEEPAKPSTRISTLGQAATTVGTNRKCDPKQLSRLCRGELDWIVMKALEKDRNRRYETASAFAADVQRYLADEPVQACPPSAWYRFRKFARRNRAALFTAGLVAAALVVGLGVATWQAVRASRAEEDKSNELAEKVKENRRANKNLHLALDGLEKIYGDLALGDLANQPHLESLRKEYLELLRDFYGEFAQANRDDPRAQFEAAKAYRRLAFINGTLGLPAEAEKNIQHAISALQFLSASGSPEVQLELAMSWYEYGIILLGGRRGAEAEQYLRKALAMVSALPPSQDRQFLWALGHVYLFSGKALSNLKRLAEAEDAQKKARNVFQQLIARSPDDAYSGQRAAAALADLARTKELGNDLKEAETLLRRARDEMEQVHKGKPNVAQFQVLLAGIEHRLALLLNLTQRPRQAEEGFRRASALCLKLASNYPAILNYRQRLIESLKYLDQCLQVTGRPAEGLAIFENLVRDYPKVPEYQLALAHTLSNRGGVLFLENQPKQGEELLRRALRVEETLMTTLDSPNVLEEQCRTLQSLAFVAVKTGRPDEAEQLSRRQLAMRKRWFAQVKERPYQKLDPWNAEFYARHQKTDSHFDVGPPADKLARSYGMLTQLLRPARRWQEISDLLDEALKLIGEDTGISNDVAWLLLTCPVVKLRDPARALRLAEKAVAVSRKNPLQAINEGAFSNTLGVARYYTGDWQAAVEALDQSRKLRQGGDASDWLFLAMAHKKLGHQTEARKWYTQAVHWLEKNRQALAADPVTGEELDRFRREAEEILGLKKK